MTIELLIDQIERALRLATKRELPIDRMEVQDLVEQALSRLAAQDEFDFLKQSLEPLIATKPSQREYRLPDNFPQNFLSFSNPDTGETSYACKLDDGSSALAMLFEQPEAFYRRDLSIETDSRPHTYTITGNPSGGKMLVLSPPPDTTTYEISGVYMLNSFDLSRDELPGAPIEVLRYDVLRQLAPQFEPNYREALANLYLTQAQVTEARFVPHADHIIEVF